MTLSVARGVWVSGAAADGDDREGKDKNVILATLAPFSTAIEAPLWRFSFWFTAFKIKLTFKARDSTKKFLSETTPIGFLKKNRVLKKKETEQRRRRNRCEWEILMKGKGKREKGEYIAKEEDKK